MRQNDNNIIDEDFGSSGMTNFPTQDNSWNNTPTQQINWGSTVNPEIQPQQNNSQPYNQQPQIDWGTPNNQQVNWNNNMPNDSVQQVNWGMDSNYKPRKGTFDWKNEKQVNYETPMHNTDNDVSQNNLPCLELRTLLKNIFTCKGRTRRREYWIGTMQLSGLLMIALAIAFNLLVKSPIIGGILVALIYIILLCCSVTLCVRRLHDIGKSGAYLLAAFVPIFNIIVGFQIAFKKSTEDNQYGPSPYKFDEYANRPLWKGVVLAFAFSIIGSTIMSVVGISAMTDFASQLNAMQQFDEIEQNYTDTYMDENSYTVNPNADVLDTDISTDVEEGQVNIIQDTDDSWKDEIKNPDLKDNKNPETDYPWGDNENHPWDTKSSGAGDTFNSDNSVNTDTENSELKITEEKMKLNE